MSKLQLPGPVVTVDWLEKHLNHPDLVVLEAAMAPVGKAGPAKVETGFLPGAGVFDIDEMSDHSSPLPHMMPSPEVFQAKVRRLGIRAQSSIVVYDRLGIFSSPRARWMFKAMGHESVAVLDGGLPAWKSAGFPVVSCAQPAGGEGDFVARKKEGLFCDADAVERASLNGSAKILDARSQGRFAGRDPEPRPGLRGGHIPGSLNLPFDAVLECGRLRPAAELRRIFEKTAGAGEAFILSCGSGVTACILGLAAEVAGYAQLCVYDGSWSEWGLPGGRPVETGEAQNG